MSSLLNDLEKRELLHSVTDRAALEQLLLSKKITFYCGFDPTADSLHVGSLLPLLVMKRLAQHGHRPIGVVGGATGMIGDPSGRSSERNLLDSSQIEKNIAGIKPQMERIVGGNVSIVSNLEWLGKLSMIEYLRDVGKLFSVNSMLTRDSVKSRLENRDDGISYTEFSYVLLQAYDFLHLFQEQNCVLQIGGSDQWGNIVSGVDLIRRKSGAQAFGLTIPLFLTSAGTKFGKTAQGTVWLDRNKTSPYRFYQFWLNTPDLDVIRVLRSFTDLSFEECDSLEKELASSPEKRAAQKRLAEALTDLVHGKDDRLAAAEAGNALFGGDVSTLSKATLEEVFSEVPSVELSRSEILANFGVAELLTRAGVVKSKGEARRLIEGGGSYLNGQKIDSPAKVIQESDLLHGSLVIIRSGKKNYFVVKVTD